MICEMWAGPAQTLVVKRPEWFNGTEHRLGAMAPIALDSVPRSRTTNEAQTSRPRKQGWPAKARDVLHEAEIEMQDGRPSKAPKPADKDGDEPLQNKWDKSGNPADGPWPLSNPQKPPSVIRCLPRSLDAIKDTSDPQTTTIAPDSGADACRCVQYSGSRQNNPLALMFARQFPIFCSCLVFIAHRRLSCTFSAIPVMYIRHATRHKCPGRDGPRVGIANDTV